MNKPALKLVSSSRFYIDEGHHWTPDEESHHSLHFAISLPESFTPSLPAFFINRYTTKRDVVLDPFCGRGTVPLQAALSGRPAFGSDINPVCVKATKAKIEPADLVHVALFMQSVNLSRPVALDGFFEYFEPFYDPDTFREIVNLKSYIANNRSQIADFVEMTAMSILHGHTAGYLSSYSLPQISLSPSKQRELNDKRGKLPEYRALAPRILRKAGAILRDGDVSRMQSLSQQNKITLADARNLTYLPKESVDLVITAPPAPFGSSYINDLWLKSWFAGSSRNERERIIETSAPVGSVAEWLDFMNEVLFELARVVRSGGRAVLDLKEVHKGSEKIVSDQLITELINTNLSSFWENECLYVNTASIPQLAKRSQQAGRGSRVLVIRRK